MTTIEIKLGVSDHPSFNSFGPEVAITIDGDHALAVEVLQYLEKFTSPAGEIEIK